MNAVMPEVTDADGSVRTEGLLPFEAPPLKLRRVNSPFRGVNGRRREIGIYCLDLSQILASGEAVDERCIRSRRILKEARLFIRRKIIPEGCEQIVIRRVDVKRLQ